MDNVENLKDKITNRHIAKLLSRIRQVMELPQIVEDDIVRQMHFLKDDLTISYGQSENEIQSRNK